MRFEVYCDESRPDLLASSSTEGRFLVIGSVWLQAENRPRVKEALRRLRGKHKFGGELKWQKISPSSAALYRELADWFVSAGLSVRFRCVAVDRHQLNPLLHDNDHELGFYKFYYQVLHHWILDFNEYAVFLDFKSNRRRDRLAVLRRCLAYANLSSKIEVVQAVRSEESPLIQLADILTGAASARLNDSLRVGGAKESVVTVLEDGLGRRVAPTPRSEQKFNVFAIDLRGGW
jgi:hypothetical protein